MFKKLWGIAVGIVLIGILLAAYFVFEPRFDAREDVFNAVPIDAMLISEINDFPNFIDKLQNHNFIWNEFQELKNIKKINRNLQYVDSILGINKTLENLVTHKPVVISAHHLGKDDIELIYLASLPENINITALQSAFEKQFQVNLEGRKYQRTSVFDFEINSNGNKYFFSVYKGVFILSSSTILVESSIRQLDLNFGILDQDGFSRVKSTSG